MVKKSDADGSETLEDSGGGETVVGPAMMTRVVVNYDPGTQPGKTMSPWWATCTF